MFCETTSFKIQKDKTLNPVKVNDLEFRFNKKTFMRFNVVNETHGYNIRNSNVNLKFHYLELNT